MHPEVVRSRSLLLSLAVVACGDGENSAASDESVSPALRDAGEQGQEATLPSESGARASPAIEAGETATVPEGPPPDWGHLKPPILPPPANDLTVHALAGYEVVAIYSKPDISSHRLGYLRLGTRLMVTPAMDGEGCPKGWHALAMGGFACASKGLVVDPQRPPYMKDPPPPPRLDHPLPYEYAYVRRWNSPMFWRVPTVDELRAAEAERTVRELARESVAAAQTAAAGVVGPNTGDSTPTLPAANSEAAQDPSTGGSTTPRNPGSGSGSPVGENLPAAPDPTSTIPTGGVDSAEPPPKLPLNPSTPWLEKGFFLSIADKVVDGGRSFWKTARGGFVETRGIVSYSAKDFRGAVLDQVEFPFGFAMGEETKVYELVGEGRLKSVSKLEKRTFVDLKEETEIAGKAYMLTEDGLLLRKDQLRIPDLQMMPAGLRPWERWIDVSLAKQILVAYEGNAPVYVTLVSTGRKGTPEEPFDTPVGRWRIRSKHITTTMDGNTASDGSYSIQDVPWAMFFEASYALHGAFWHRGFGYVRSHGCVNLGPTDARWLFHWTTPYLPDGWHGVHSNDDTPGTTVVVRAD